MNQAEALFIEETGEVLSQLEEILLTVQSDQFDQEQHNSIFRMLHTVKGSLHMFDRSTLGDFTHRLEAVFEEFNETQQALSDELIQLMLNAVDFIRETFHEQELQTKDQRDLLELLSESISSSAETALSFVGHKPKSNDTCLSICYLSAQPRIVIKENDSHPLHFIIRDLLEDHESIGHSEVEDSRITTWRLLFLSEMTEEDIQALFLFVEDDLEYTITQFPLKGITDDVIKLSEFENALKTDQEQAIIQHLEQYATSIVDKQIDTPYPETTSQVGGAQAKTQQTTNATNYIRVEQDKIDDLMNWVSELVTIQATLKNQAETAESEALLHVSDSIHAITENLRDTIFSIRLVPLKTLETGFTRLVRELSRSLGKEVTFQSSGFETELDRKVIANLKEPLLHILRNSLDHGIELPDVRTQLGKTRSGNIQLESYYSGNLVYIEISDDGAGIDPEKIRKKATEKGLLQEDRDYTDDEIMQLSFHPGLSTADEISDISGRGVGMDVVKRKIQELRGEVFITSELGKGTKTIVKLPLSLSIMEGLHTKVGETHLVIPMNTIREVHRFPRKQFYDRPKGSDILEFEGRQMSVVSIEEKYNITASQKSTIDVITVNVGNHEKGVAVDEIKGQVQTVLKPLGDYYEKQDFILGGTILGDGNLAFVLDMEKLIN